MHLWLSWTRVLAVGLVTLVAVRGADAQTPPVFKSGVELITIDVSVIDKAGDPVRSLRSDQFQVMVDDRPRRVVSAELVEHAPPAGEATPLPAANAVRRAYSSNELHEIPVAPGRLIFIAIDQASFTSAGIRGAGEAARRFIDRLEPHDRVGLLAFPAPGLALSASNNHEAARQALSRLAGVVDPLASSALGVSLSLTEALEIEARNDAVLAGVSDRECRALNGVQLPACVESVRQEAQQMAMRAEQQANRTLGGLRSVVSRMAAIQERKTLVVISAGLLSTERTVGRLDTRGEVLSIARDAADANANIYVLQIDSSMIDAGLGSARRSNDTAQRDTSMWAAGLENLAAASGGTVFRVTSGSSNAIDRVLQETAATYVLGIEPEPGDRNNKPHTIKVSVTVPGAQVRSRRDFVLGTSAPMADTPVGLLVAALRSSRVETALPIGVSTHTLGQSESGGLRVLISVNVGRGVREPIDTQVGYVITDTAGRMVGNSLDKQRLTVPASSGTGAASYVSLVGLKPGDYNLRLAVVDASGRVGSVEHPFSTGLADGEGIVMSDLLLLDPERPHDEMLAPLADGRLRGRTVDAYLEFYPRADDALPTSVSFGIADQPDGEPMVRTQAPAAKKDAGGRSTAEARLDLSLLPPGDYVVVATITAGGRRLGRRHQLLTIEAPESPGEVGTVPTNEAPRVRFLVGETSSLVKTFTTTDVLTPAALDYFTGRLAAADTGPAHAAVATSITALRRGEFDAVVSALRDVSPERLSVVFLRGLGLLGKGELEPAAVQFREALRIADDFLPAAFYLGACYAAGGRDREAAGAWQTALITESDARIIYDVLTDALLRLGDASQAIEILTEARGRWPDDAAWLPRLAAAQATLQRRDEALSTLATYLNSHQSDAEASALAIRLIYDAHAAGRKVASSAFDRALAMKYGAMYKAAGGTNQALIDRWVAFIAKS